MHSSINTNLVHSRLTRLAREYRQRGYQVILHPSSENLPQGLSDFSFDLIAKRNGSDKVIAAVVRTRQTLALNGPHDLRRMTERIEQQPNWDLELIITNPRRGISPNSAIDASLSA